MQTHLSRREQRAFTLVELLTVIAIIAVLAAILFPVFGAIREQTRQSSTMSNMHAVYLGARLFYEDEGRFPPSLFGYAETCIYGAPNPDGTCPADPADSSDSQEVLSRPATPGDAVKPMDKATEVFDTNQGLNYGYLYNHQVKDYNDFLCADNLVTNKSAVTEVYWPLSSPLSNGQMVPVTWTAGTTSGNCPVAGDYDFPINPDPADASNWPAYQGQPKLYYVMDSMDIGPMLNTDGTPMKDSNGNQLYELHYTPDWTHQLYNAGLGCDCYGGTPNGVPIVTQLKYQNPPTENTIITWNTFHTATSGSPSVIILLDSGTARKMNYATALKQLPLGYR